MIQAASFAHRVEVAVPAETHEIVERLDLPAQSNEQAQPLLDRCPFRRKPRRRHRRGEQIVVDLDIQSFILIHINDRNDKACDEL